VAPNFSLVLSCGNFWSGFGSCGDVLDNAITGQIRNPCESRTVCCGGEGEKFRGHVPLTFTEYETESIDHLGCDGKSRERSTFR
jgi:hypothetical protein